MIAQRDSYKAELEAEVTKLRELLCRYYPPDIISALACENLLVNPETYKEYEHEGQASFVEYVSLLYLSEDPAKLNWSSGTPLTTVDVKEIQEQIRSLFMKQMWAFALGDLGKEYAEKVGEHRLSTLANSLMVRHPGYQRHLDELLHDLSAPLEESLKRTLGFSINDAVMIGKVILRCVPNRLIALSHEGSALEKQVKKAVDRYRKKKQHTRGIPKEIVAEFAKLTPREFKRRSGVIKLAYSAFRFEEILEFDAESLAKITKVPVDRIKAFLEAMSIDFGSVDKRYRFPSPTHPLQIKPFIRLANERFLCPVPQNVTWAIKPLVESLLNPESADCKDPGRKAWDVYARRRSDYTETTALHYLTSMLKRAKPYQNLKYRTVRADKSIEEDELDGLILFDDWCILAEVKSGTLAADARRGAPKGMVEELESKIGQAHYQLHRAKAFVLSSSTPEFVLADGTTVTIDRSTYKRIVTIVVTLEELDVFIASLYKLKQMGLLPGDQLPWAVSLLDLRVISEILDFPSQFIHYLEKRNRINELRIATTHDELDWFCRYLHAGLYFEDVENEDDRPTIQFLSHTTDLDSYYMHIHGERQSVTAKPSMKLPPNMKFLIDELEAAHPVGYTAIVSFLLDLSGEARKELHEGIASISGLTRLDGKIHSWMTEFRCASTGLAVFSCQPNDLTKMAERLKMYSILKKYQRRLNQFIAFGLTCSPKMKVECILMKDQPWSFDAKTEECVNKVLQGGMYDPTGEPTSN